MEWWVGLLLGVEALILIAGAVSLIRVLMGRGREDARAAENGRRAWEAREAAQQRHAELILEREREIADIVAAWGG